MRERRLSENKTQNECFGGYVDKYMKRKYIGRSANEQASRHVDRRAGK